MVKDFVSKDWAAGNGPLASLGSSSLAARFRAWRGASGRRYVASIYPVDRYAEDAGLPRFDAFVLVSVRREGFERRSLGVVAVEGEAERHAALADALAGGVDEWHVHLLARARSDRATLVADLRARQAHPVAGMALPA